MTFQDYVPSFSRLYSKTYFQDKMGASSSKTVLITKPAQSGKDRSVVNRIKEHQMTCDLFGFNEMITIIFHGLAKSLGSQKSSRMAADSETFDASKIFLWNSNGGKDTYTEAGIKNANCSAKELFTDILINDIKYILCCDIKRRWDTVKELCEVANNYASKNASFPGIRIVVDEADARMDTWRIFEDFAATCCSVREIVLVTATPDSIITRYKQIKVAAEIKPIDPEYYVGCAEQDFVIHDICHASALEYVETLFELSEVSSRFTPGSRWFVPADIDRDSHDTVKDWFIAKKANVAVINGVDKKIFLHDGKHYDISEEIASGTEELGQIIKNYWAADPRLHNAPFIITGNLCVERGISFQDSREGVFLFDTAILSSITDKDKAYQTLSRMFGNIKKVRGDHKGTIFTTTTMKKKCEEQEKLAIRLNEVALSRTDNIVTKNDLKAIKTGKDLTKALIRMSFVCNSFEEAQTTSVENWGITLHRKGRVFNPDGSGLAAFDLRKKFFDPINKKFNNPTQEYIMNNRFWGLDDDEKEDCRCVPIQDGKWLVYGYLKKSPTPSASIDELLGSHSAAPRRKRPSVAAK